MTDKVLRGAIHGNTIELHEKVDLAEGQRVEIVLRRVLTPAGRTGEGLLRTEGALADDPQWDAIMHEISASR